MSEVGGKSEGDVDEEWGKEIQEEAKNTNLNSDVNTNNQNTNQKKSKALPVDGNVKSHKEHKVVVKDIPANGEGNRFHRNEGDGNCKRNKLNHHVRTGRKESSIPVGIAVAWKRTDIRSAANSVEIKADGKQVTGINCKTIITEAIKGGKSEVKRCFTPGLSSPNLPKRPSSLNSASCLNLKDSRGEGVKNFRFSELTQIRPASASCVGGNQVIPAGMRSPFMDSQFPFPGLNLGGWAHLAGMSKGEAAYMGYGQLTPGQQQQLLELQWSQQQQEQQHLYRDPGTTFAHGYLYSGILPDALQKYEQYLQQSEMQRQAQNFHLHHSLLQQQQQYLQQDYDLHRATPIPSPSFSIPSPSLLTPGVSSASSMWPPEFFHHNSTTTLSPKSLASSSPSPVTVQQQQDSTSASLLSPVSYNRQGATPSPYSNGHHRTRIPSVSPFSPAGNSVGREQGRPDTPGNKVQSSVTGESKKKSRMIGNDVKVGKPAEAGTASMTPVKKRHDFSRMESLIERRDDVSVPLLHCRKVDDEKSSAGSLQEEITFETQDLKPCLQKIGGGFEGRKSGEVDEIKCEKGSCCEENNGGRFSLKVPERIIDAKFGGGKGVNAEPVKLLRKLEDCRKWKREIFEKSEKSERCLEDIFRRREDSSPGPVLEDPGGRDVKYSPGWRKSVDKKLGGEECNGKFPGGRELLMHNVKVERDEGFGDEISYCGQPMLRKIKREVGSDRDADDKHDRLVSSLEVKAPKVNNKINVEPVAPPLGEVEGESILKGKNKNTNELTNCDKDIKCPANKLVSPISDASNNSANSFNSNNSCMYSGGVANRNNSEGGGGGAPGLLDLANAVDSANLRMSSLMDCPPATPAVLREEDGKYKCNKDVNDSDGTYRLRDFGPIEQENDHLDLLATVAQEFGNEILNNPEGIEGNRRNSSDKNILDSGIQFSNSCSSLDNPSLNKPSTINNSKMCYASPPTIKLKTFGPLDSAIVSDNSGSSNVLKNSTPDQAISYALSRTLKRPHGHPAPPVASVAPVVLRIPHIQPQSHTDKHWRSRKKSGSDKSRHESGGSGQSGGSGGSVGGESELSGGKIPVLKIRKNKSPNRFKSTEEYTAEEIRSSPVEDFQVLLSESATKKHKKNNHKKVLFCENKEETEKYEQRVLPLKLKKRRSTTDGNVMSKGTAGINFVGSKKFEDNHRARTPSPEKPVCTGEFKMTFSRQLSGTDAFTSAFTTNPAYSRQRSWSNNNDTTDFAKSMPTIGEKAKSPKSKKYSGSFGNIDRSHHNQEESYTTRADLKIRIINSKSSASKVTCVDESEEGGNERYENMSGAKVDKSPAQYSSCFNKSEKYSRNSGDEKRGVDNSDAAWLMSPSVASDGTDWEADPALAVTAIKTEESKTQNWLAQQAPKPTQFLTYEDLAQHTKQKSRRESHGSGKKIKSHKTKRRHKSSSKNEHHIKPCLKAEPVFREASCHEEDEDELPSIDGDESSDARSSTIYLARRSHPLPRRISMNNDRLEDEEELYASSLDHFSSAVTEAIGDVEDNEVNEDTENVEEVEVCFSSVEELVDEMRILTEIQGLFYTGKLNALQPPDVYGVTLDNERGAPPHFIFSAEEVLEKCIREVKPVKLVHGLRICAYWSPQYSGLYAGKVSTDYDPNFDAENDLIPIEFDDGDTGVIKRKEIRLLSKNHPIREYDPNPLLTLEKKQRKRRHSSANTSQSGCNGDHEEADCGEPYCAKAPKISEEDGGGGRPMYMSSRMMYWTWKGLGFRKPKSKKDRNKEFFNGIQRGDEEINVGDSALFISNGNVRPFIGRVEKFWEKKGKKIVNVRWFYHPEEVQASSKKLQGLKYAGALFESPHIDENDVQTIAKKCQVLSFDEFKKLSNNLTKWTKNSVHTGEGYYVAGFYDPYTYKLQLKDLK